MEMKQYLSREAYFEGEQYRHTGVTVRIGENDNDEIYLEIEYGSDKDQGMLGWNTIADYKLDITFSDIDQVKLLNDTISQWFDTGTDTRIRRDLGEVSGHYSDQMHHTFQRDKNIFESDVDSLEAVIRADGLHLNCYKSGEYVDNAYIPGTTEEIDNEDQNTDNIEAVQELLNDFISYYGSDTDVGELPDLITSSLEKNLAASKFGSEVLNHLQEGDQCFEHELYNPALGSYVHAIEWLIISYLESEAGIDIIERKQNGQPYYFASSEHNLLDELTNHVSIDQKTVSRLESMNRAERRWMAHHKSGVTLPDEVSAVRSRLGELVQALYS